MGEGGRDKKGEERREGGLLAVADGKEMRSVTSAQLDPASGWYQRSVTFFLFNSQHLQQMCSVYCQLMT